MNQEEKTDIGLAIAQVGAGGAGIVLTSLAALEMRGWAWALVAFFVIGFAMCCCLLWARVELIVCRVRIEEIDSHLADLDKIRSLLVRPTGGQ